MPPQTARLFTTYEGHQLSGDEARATLQRCQTIAQPPGNRPEEEGMVVKPAATLRELEQGVVTQQVVTNAELPATAQLAAVGNVAGM